jgi:Flp pilus assembly protein TadG
MKLSHRPRFAPGRHEHERGAVLVEFATVAIFLVVLLAGAFDFGMAWRAGLGVTEAARAGARVGSSGGIAVTADRDLLLSVQAALASSELINDVDRVVVYNATTNAAVPATCKTGTGNGEPCDAFTASEFKAITAGSALDANGCIVDSARKGFCPKTRNSVQLTANYLGIWVRIRYDYQFGVLGSSRLIERTAVMRIEPPA